MNPEGAPAVVCIGRLGVDLYPLQVGRSIPDVESFGKFLGGSAANVSVACARLGHASMLVSRVGDDPFGAYLTRELARLDVDPELVWVDPVYQTPITFCEIFPPDDFPLYFYRNPKAPDLEISVDQLPDSVVEGAAMLWVTATGLSRSPSRETHFDALARRARSGRSANGHTVLDLDYRAAFWDDPAEASAMVGAALESVTIAVGNREECFVAVGETDPDRAADALLERGVEVAIVKQGPQGVLAKTADETVLVPAAAVEVVNGLGAGDAFGGALCHGMLSGWPLERTIRYAAAAGAIVAGRLECSTAMPTREEVDAMVASDA